MFQYSYCKKLARLILTLIARHRRGTEEFEVCGCSAWNCFFWPSFLSLYIHLSLYFSDRKSSKDFAVIGVQAYAERNQCGEAVTFASQVFGSSEGLPVEVLELWQVYIFSLMIPKINKFQTLSFEYDCTSYPWEALLVKVYEKRRISQSTNSAASSAGFSRFCAYYDVSLHCACCKWKGWYSL